MTPQQALQLLDHASAQAPLDRKSHVLVQQAAEVLKKALEPKEEQPAAKT